ncbi:uncharacterized protein C1orf94 homolog [Alca torda]
MLAGRNSFSAPIVTSEGPFPLGPFPRHIWIHSNTPQDSLDKTCHEIWKRVQQLSGELQPPSLVPRLQHGPCPEPPGSLQRDSRSSRSTNSLLDEPVGLESIYRTMIGNREREMKLRALCDAQLSAKSVVASLLCSAKSHKNSKGPEDGSVTGTRSTEGSKAEVPFLPKYPDTTKGAGNQITTEETKAVKELVQSSAFSSAKSSTAGSSTAASQTTEQKQLLPSFAEICSKTDSNAMTKNPGMNLGMVLEHQLGAMEKLRCKPEAVAKQQASVHHFLYGDVLSKPHGLYHQRARMPYQQAPHPSFGCYLRQVAPYSPQQIFQPPYAPLLNYIPLVQPGYPYQQRTPPPLSSNIRDLPPGAGNGIQYPFSPSYRFNSTPGGAVTINLNYFSSENHVKF